MFDIFYQEGYDFTKVKGAQFELTSLTDGFVSFEGFGEAGGLLVDEFNFTKETRMVGLDSYTDTYGEIYKVLPVQVKEVCKLPPTQETSTATATEVIEDKSTLLIAILVPLVVILLACVIISICVCRKKFKKKEASDTHDKDNS